MRNSLKSIAQSVRVPVGLFLLMAVVVMPSAAFSTTVVHRSVEEMTRVSELVISGTVVDVSVGATTRAGLPATRVRIAVDSVLKGFATGPTIVLTIPGGVRDGRVLRIPGMPSFTEGEETVVFLERTPVGWIPSGLGNGKYTIETDSSGRRVAYRGTAGLHRVGATRSLTDSELSGSDSLLVDDLVRRIEKGRDVRRPAPDVLPGSGGRGGVR